MFLCPDESKTNAGILICVFLFVRVISVQTDHLPSTDKCTIKFVSERVRYPCTRLKYFLGAYNNIGERVRVYLIAIRLRVKWSPAVRFGHYYASNLFWLVEILFRIVEFVFIDGHSLVHIQKIPTISNKLSTKRIQAAIKIILHG